MKDRVLRDFAHVGWIDRQWAEDDFAKHQDPESSRYRNEWRVIQLDNGWDLSCFHQYLRDQRNAVVPLQGEIFPARQIHFTAQAEEFFGT